MEDYISEAEKLEALERGLEKFKKDLEQFEVPGDDGEAVPKMLKLLVNEYFDEDEDDMGFDEFMEGMNDAIGDLFGDDADFSKLFGNMFSENTEIWPDEDENVTDGNDKNASDADGENASDTGEEKYSGEDETAAKAEEGFGGKNPFAGMNAADLFNMMVDSGLYEGMLGEDKGNADEDGENAEKSNDVIADEEAEDAFEDDAYEDSGFEEDEEWDEIKKPFLTTSDGSDLFEILSSAMVFGKGADMDEPYKELFTELFGKLSVLSEESIEKDAELADGDGTPLYNDGVAKFFENRYSPVGWDILSEMLLICAMTEEGDEEAERKLEKLCETAAGKFADWKDLYVSVLFGLLFATDIQSPENDGFVLDEVSEQIIEILERKLKGEKESEDE